MTTLSARLGYAFLAGIALLHIVLAIAYANVTPYRTAGYLSVAKSRPWSAVPDIGAPDERQHANYVLNILRGQGLPVYRVMIPDPVHPGQLMRNPDLDEVYEFHQAPLYYLLDAGLARVFGVDWVAGQDPHEGIPLRYPNALFGAATVLGVYFLAIWGIGRRDVALLAAAITALLPMNVALSGAISNDPLLFCITTWTLAICAKAIRAERWTWSESLTVGALVGLGLITKETALALIPVVLLAFFLHRPGLVKAFACGALAFAIALPWWIRNQVLYGDPLGLKSFQQLFAGAPKASDMMGAFGFVSYWLDWVAWWTARSFFGVFSYMDIFLNEHGNSATGPGAPNALYRILIALAAIAAFGFILSIGKTDSPQARKVHLLNGVFLAIVTVLFLRYNISFFQGQARYFFPAVGPISIGLAMGTLHWARSRSRLVTGTIVVGLIALNLYALSKLPSEFAKRINPTLANQVGGFIHPSSKGTRITARQVGAQRLLEVSSA